MVGYFTTLYPVLKPVWTLRWGKLPVPEDDWAGSEPRSSSLVILARTSVAVLWSHIIVQSGSDTRVVGLWYASHCTGHWHGIPVNSWNWKNKGRQTNGPRTRHDPSTHQDRQGPIRYCTAVCISPSNVLSLFDDALSSAQAI